MKKFLIFLFIILLFSNLITYSQKIIRGTILNENKIPLDSVKVSVKDTNLFVYSNKEGKYIIEVPQGKKIISFEKKGYIVKELEVKKDLVNITMTREIVSIFDLTLEELLALEVKIASHIDLPLRESPGIVSVITKEEIKNAGCRDMIDVLRLVPGIEFGVDVQGITSIIMRGNWAHEGKVLLMIDGIELNELSYSTIQLGHRICVDQIERVEIIRGPGSSIYGGFAELGVINIITKDKNSNETFRIGANYGQMKKTYGHRNIHATLIKSFDSKSYLKILSFFGQANRSEKIYTDIFGNQYDMTHQSSIYPQMIMLQTQIHNFDFKLLFDRYQVSSRDNFSQITSKPYLYSFTNFAIESKYEFNITPKIKIIPQINFRYNKPWFTKDYIDTPDQYLNVLYFNNVNNRYNFDFKFKYDITPFINLLTGIDLYRDVSYNLSKNYDSLFWNNQKEIYYNNLSFYSQLFIKNKLVNLTFGVRTENHSQYGLAIAHRLAITRALTKLHIKLLFSSAFRSPGFQNIELNAKLSPEKIPFIKPEKLYISEFEFGYQFNSKILLLTNFFILFLKDPIIYFIDENSMSEGYKNSGKTGSKGLEMVFKYFDKKINIDFNISYYDTKNINTVDDYKVENNPNVLLGAPQFKLNINFQYQINHNLNFYIGNTFLSEKYGFKSIDNDIYIIEKFSPVNLLNVLVNYNNFIFKKVNLGVGVYNILDDQYFYLQPYKGGHAPLPSASREFIIKLSFGF